MGEQRPEEEVCADLGLYEPSQQRGCCSNALLWDVQAQGGDGVGLLTNEVSLYAFALINRITSEHSKSLAHTRGAAFGKQ